MTSGEFHRIPVDKIWFDRAERHRKELKESDTKALADSIRRLGLIHPLVIGRDYKLHSGEHRFAAVKMLGHDFVMCQYLDELDPAQQKLVQLEENTKRTDLTWQEIMDAVTDYHEIQRSRPENKGSWTHQQTADGLGMPRPNVTHYFTVSEAANIDKSLREHKLFSTAREIVQRTKERQIDIALREAVGEPTTHEEKDIINKDFCDWAPAYPEDAPKSNFLHCDFPYGIGTDKRGQGTAADVHGGYDDSADRYWTLLKVLCDNLDRFCAESAHLMFWFSMHHYEKTLKFL